MLAGVKFNYRIPFTHIVTLDNNPMTDTNLLYSVTPFLESSICRIKKILQSVMIIFRNFGWFHIKLSPQLGKMLYEILIWDYQKHDIKIKKIWPSRYQGNLKLFFPVALFCFFFLICCQSDCGGIGSFFLFFFLHED